MNYLLWMVDTTAMMRYAKNKAVMLVGVDYIIKEPLPVLEGVSR